MIIRKRVVLPSIIFVILLVIILFTIREGVELVAVNQRLRSITQLVVKENRRTFRETQQFKQKLLNAEAERLVASKIAEERKQSVLDHRVVNEVIWIYQKAGTLRDYHWINPYTVYNRLMEIRKWKHLAGKTDDIDIELWALCWALEETNLNPSLRTKEEDGTTSWGMMQINDKCLKYLSGESWHNPESNIKAWMRWAKSRRDVGWSITPKNRTIFWHYYWRLGLCKKVN